MIFALSVTFLRHQFRKRRTAGFQSTYSLEPNLMTDGEIEQLHKWNRSREKIDGPFLVYMKHHLGRELREVRERYEK